MASIKHTAILSIEPLTVWHVLRQFGAISTWHPEVHLCVIAGGEETGDGGSVRTLYLINGEVIRERLHAIDNDEMTVSYGLTGPTMLVSSFSASLSLSRTGQGAQTLLEWAAHVVCDDDGLEARYESQIGEFVLSAIDGLAEHLGVSVRLDVEL